MYTSEFMNIAYFGKDIKNLSQKGQKSLDSIFELLENIESKKYRIMNIDGIFGYIQVGVLIKIIISYILTKK